MSMSVYLAKKVLEHTLNVAAYTPPVTLYMALFTSANGLESNTSASWNEVTGFDYARTPITGADFTVSTVPEATNSATIDFPTVNGGSWGTVTHMAIMDAAANGNVMFWGELTVNGTPTPIVPNDTNIVRFAAGKFTATLD